MSPSRQCPGLCISLPSLQLQPVSARSRHLQPSHREGFDFSQICRGNEPGKFQGLKHKHFKKLLPLLTKEVIPPPIARAESTSDGRDAAPELLGFLLWVLPLNCKIKKKKSGKGCWKTPLKIFSPLLAFPPPCCWLSSRQAASCSERALPRWSEANRRRASAL